MRARHLLMTAAFLLVFTPAQVAWAQGHINIDFYAEPGTGFDDPTPAAPVGGNPGLTVGQQRVFVFLQAAAIWEETIKPQQDIWLAAEFVPLGPGVLGAAGPQFIWSNFPGAELPNTWYFDSLADNLFEGDLSPITYDILATFSSDAQFYLGLDNNDAPGQSDLLVTVLHEIGHGLNFANAVDESTGAMPTPPGATAPFGDIYSQHTMDVTTSKRWNEMTDPERAASAINVRKVSWSGLHLRLNQHRVLERGEPAVRVLSTGGLDRLMLGTASFGPALTGSGITGTVVLAQSAGGLTDGCAAITSAVAGGIALIDRGTCTFTVKVKNAQDAGAIAVLIGDNVLALPPPGLGGADATITIPSGRISLTDANTIKANLAGGVRVRMLLDKTVVAGTDRVKGQVMLAAFNPVVPGSSISHFEAVASPNQIMEPAINADLVSSLQPPEDLTTPLLTDLGWFTDRDGVQDGVDLCLGSDPSPTVVIGSCDSGVPNTVRPSGCNITDVLNLCGGLHGRAYEACVSLATFVLRLGGEISSSQQKAINRCVR